MIRTACESAGLLYKSSDIASSLKKILQSLYLDYSQQLSFTSISVKRRTGASVSSKPPVVFSFNFWFNIIYLSALLLPQASLEGVMGFSGS